MDAKETVEWIRKYNPGDLVWLRSPGYPTIKGDVINRSKTELFVRIFWGGEYVNIAVTDQEIILPRKEGDEMPLSMCGKNYVKPK